LEYVTAGDVVCDNTVDGICILPSACENYRDLLNYSFRVRFTDTIDDNYIRVPLSIFAYDKFDTFVT